MSTPLISTPPVGMRPAPRPAGSPQGAPQPPGWPLLRLGLRPFYLGAAALAMLGMVWWMGLLAGAVPAPRGLPAVLWHAHEMVLGFLAAAIAGFLLTAGKAWTGLATPRGPALGALVLLWGAARVAAVTGPVPLFVVLDAAFLPVLATVFLHLLLRAGNHRNLGIAVVLGLLSAANLAFHGAALGWLVLPPERAIHAALALVVVLASVIGGRVIPAFTRSAVPAARPRNWPWLDRSAIAATLLGLGAWVCSAPAVAAGPLLAAAALLQAARLLAWTPWVARRRPILWVLPLAYAWIPVGLALLAAAQAAGVPASAGLHALAVGACGGLIIGMFTRTARGHTGRPIQASPLEVACYALVMLAAALRVAASLAPALQVPQLYQPALAGAAAAWVAAFLLYLWRFAPWLAATRVDGRDG